MTTLRCPKCQKALFVPHYRRDFEWLTLECSNDECDTRIEFINLRTVPDWVINELHERVVTKRRSRMEGVMLHEDDENAEDA
jgi:hypothetical protein